MRCGVRWIMINPFIVLSTLSFLLLLLSTKAEGSCTPQCNAYRPYLCIAPSLYSPNLEVDLRTEIKKRFSVCLHDSARSRFIRVNLEKADKTTARMRDSISVTMLECDEVTDWRTARIRSWPPPATKGCQSDLSILLLIINGKIVPVIIGNLSEYPLTLNDDGSVLLTRSYTIDAIADLFDELFGVMSPIPSTTTEAPLLSDGFDGRMNGEYEEEQTTAHWPTWAIVVLIVSVILSIVAFAIGNCINKRNSPRPLKSNKVVMPPKRRNWGAGFSGGMWAAA